MLIFILLLQLLQFSYGLELLVSSQCEELFKHQINPRTCCTIPEITPTRQIHDECSKKCKTTSDVCCKPDCLYESSGVYVDGNFSKENYFKGYELYFTVKNAIDERNEWMPLIEESFRYCEIILSTPSKSSTCKVPEPFDYLYFCMRQENFIACPKRLLKKSSKCSAIVEFVEENKNCKVEYGGKPLIDSRFWTYHSGKLPIECIEIFGQNSPVDCCTIPEPWLSVELESQCETRCADKPEEECCQSVCYYEGSGLYKNGEFSKANLIKGFKAYFSRFQLNDTKVEEKWMPVIENSIESCISLTVDSKELKWCDIVDFFPPLFACVKKFNFINCPISKATDKCERSKKFVENYEKCGEKHGEIFLIDHRFWETKDGN